MRKPTGFVIYRGPSLLDGKPIVAIALTASGNRKTGNMVQTYILADNGERPNANAQSGADSSVCGDCKHRPINGGACYVVLAQGPTVVTKTLWAGKYPIAQDVVALGSERMVRLGTYGDPAAVPASIWAQLVSKAAGHTGYTHQWRNAALGGAQLEALKATVMASCDTPSERDEARSMGWRTFTVRLADEPIAQRETMCPASHEAGVKLRCAQCGLCNGAASGRKGSIAIIAHGSKLNRYIAIRLATAIR